jgi:hypothetical protein
MIPPLDLFKKDAAGTVWLDSLPSLDAAVARAKELAKSQPGEYFVFSQKTGNKHFIKMDESVD